MLSGPDRRNSVASNSWAGMQPSAARLYRRSHEEIASIPGRRIGRPDDFCARGSSHMGRGRAKAKQTKVARKLKYHAPNTDLRALERELSGGREDAEDVEPDEDPYDAYADRYNPDDDEVREDDWVPPDKKLAVSEKSASPHGRGRGPIRHLQSTIQRHPLPLPPSAPEPVCRPLAPKQRTRPRRRRAQAVTARRKPSDTAQCEAVATSGSRPPRCRVGAAAVTAAAPAATAGSAGSAARRPAGRWRSPLGPAAARPPAAGRRPSPRRPRR